MKKLIGKGYDSLGTAFNAAQKWLWENKPGSFDCDFRMRDNRYSKYLEVVGKPYRVYFFLRSVECIDAYFFSTADEGSKEVEKLRKKAWERVKKDVSLANTRCE